MRRRRSIDWELVGGILGLLLIIGIVVLGVWLRFFAPCGAVTWMPVKDVPARCLSVDVR